MAAVNRNERKRERCDDNDEDYQGSRGKRKQNDYNDEDYYGTGGMPKFMKRAFFTEVVSTQPIDSDFSDVDESDEEYLRRVEIQCYNVPVRRECKDDPRSMFTVIKGPLADFKLRPYNGRMDVCEEYFRYNGYLPCRKTIRLVHERPHIFNLPLAISVFGHIPDDNVMRNRGHPLLQLLQTLLSLYDAKCKEFTISSRVLAARSLPDLTNSTVGRLWLMLRLDLFYCNLLPRILKLSHLPIHRSSENSDGGSFSFLKPVWYVREHATQTMLIILFARISNDMFYDSFFTIVIERDLMLSWFLDAMDNGYVILSVVFSLFVDSAVVHQACRRNFARRYHTTCGTSLEISSEHAIWYMLILRDLPFVGFTEHKCPEYESDAMNLPRLISGIFCGENLTVRALERVIRHHGLTVALQLAHRFNLPTSITRIIHQYFYVIMWRFVTTMDSTAFAIMAV